MFCFSSLVSVFFFAKYVGGGGDRGGVGWFSNCAPGDPKNRGQASELGCGEGGCRHSSLFPVTTVPLVTELLLPYSATCFH